jgi:methylase of polypeptide subunit release factors
MEDAPRIADAAIPARLRTALIDAGYTDTGITERTGARDLIHVRPRREGRQRGVALDTRLDVLIRLFFDQEYVDPEPVERILPSTLLADLRATNLIARHEQGYVSVAIFYPVEELYIASDRSDPPDDRPFKLRTDAVYPALTEGSAQLFKILPRTPCENFLEACGGSGTIAAWAVKHHARKAWSADILPRCTAFAAFNAWVNQADAVQTVTGDLYEPVASERFDRIVAHPPHVPQEKVELVYRDGGHDGEQIFRALVRGLPDALTPGGRAYILTFATDRKGSPLEMRIREWLGEQEGEFDILLIEALSGTPEEIVPRIPSRRDTDALIGLMRALDVTQMVFSLSVIQRRSEQRPVFTIRRGRLTEISGADLEALLQLATTTAGIPFLSQLRDAALGVPDGILVQLRQHAVGGMLSSPLCWVSTKTPIPLETEAPYWFYQFFNAIDGVRTAGDIFELLRSAGIFSPESEYEGFQQAILWLFYSGLVKAPGL